MSTEQLDASNYADLLMTYYNSYENALITLWQDFWWCEELTTDNSKLQTNDCEDDLKIQIPALSDDEKSTKETLVSENTPKKKSQLPDIDENLQSLLARMALDQKVAFTPSHKSGRGLHNGTSKRRSQYIGVLRNGQRWQVLINIGRKKKYIGTYCNEKEAALVHDFYAMGINTIEAKTNFKYDEAIIKDMISSYYDQDLEFDPSAFVERV